MFIVSLYLVTNIKKILNNFSRNGPNMHEESLLHGGSLLHEGLFLQESKTMNKCIKKNKKKKLN